MRMINNTFDDNMIINYIDRLIELSRYYTYDEDYLNHIKKLEKLKNKIEDDGISSVLRKDEQDIDSN